MKITTAQLRKLIREEVSKANLNEASEVDFNTLQPNQKKQVVAVEKILRGKHIQIFQGMHGTIVVIKTPPSPMSYRFDADTMKQLLAVNVRWVQADKGSVSVGLVGF